MLRFLIGFAWRDLTDRYALRTTLVVFFTIAVVCAFTLGLFGFTLGVEQVRLHRIKADPMTLCLWTGDTLVHGRITAPVLEELRREVKTSVGEDGFVGVYPFREVDFVWQHKERGEVRAKGRTIALEEPRDPLFKSRPVKEGGREFTGKDDEGIIITPQMLLELGLASDTVPDSVNMVSNRGKLVKVKVLGMTSLDLPTYHSFVVPEAYAYRLRSDDPDPELKYVYTGPLPEKWPKKMADLPEAVQESFKIFKLHPPFPEEKDGKTIWFLRTRNGGTGPDDQLPTLSSWMTYVRTIEELMVKDYPVNKEFTQLDDRGQVDFTVPVRTDHDLAAIYVTDLQYLAPAAEACERVKAGEEHLQVRRGVVEQVTNIGKQTQLALRAFSVILGVLVLIALWNMFVIQKLRAEQKIAEIGMLKAMGMGRRTLLGLCLIEAAMLWVGGAVLGVGLGLAAEWGLSRWWYRDNPEEALLGFYWSPRLIVVVLVASGAACLGCVWRATHNARRAPPSESLRASN